MNSSYIQPFISSPFSYVNKEVGSIIGSNAKNMPENSSELKGGITNGASWYRMRADYIPFLAAAAHSDNLSYAVQKQSSLQSCSNLTNTIVVLPSIDVDAEELTRMCGVIPPEHYEERQLYHLILLMKDPSIRIIFVSSDEVSQDSIRYYLTLDGCSDLELEERRSRLFLLNTEVGSNPNASYLSLNQKMFQNEEILESIRRLVDEVSNNEGRELTNTVGISYYCGSTTGDAIAQRLNMRALEASEKDLYFGCKQGCRELLTSCHVPCSPGTPGIGDEDLLTEPDNNLHWSKNHKFICTPHNLAKGIARLIINKNVKPRKWVVKLNQGFSGKGNATFDLQSIQNQMYVDENGHFLKGDAHVNAMANDIVTSFSKMQFVCDHLSWERFVDQMARLGAIAEAFIEGYCATSPSVQAVIDPDLKREHRVRILSTHEQVLTGQVYGGCVNPAAAPYRSLIVEYTKRLGEELVSRGVVGHFSADFLAENTRADATGSWNVTGVEMNLRQGGTTHPFSTMAALCGGQTCSDGIFRMQSGDERYYEATDSFTDCRLSGLKSSVFLSKYLNSFDSTAQKLRWNNSEKVGVVFHLLSVLEKGKIGFTAIGRTPIHARELCEGTKRVLKRIAETWASEKV